MLFDIVEYRQFKSGQNRKAIQVGQQLNLSIMSTKAKGPGGKPSTTGNPSRGGRTNNPPKR